MNINHAEAWRMLNEMDDILLLTHRNPDGDAVGSVFALYRVLKALGKNVRCISDTITGPLKTAVVEEAYAQFEEAFVVSVDLADKKLLSDSAAAYGDRVDLCIDHHVTNLCYAKYTLVDSGAAAACEVLFDMLRTADFKLTSEIASALYIGIATDTGCFRYPNTTSKTLKTAAALVDSGADNGGINKMIFETKSRAYVRFEAMAMNSMKSCLDGKCAVMVLTRDMFEKTGISEAEIHGIAALPRQIEGVMAGIVIKEREDGSYKISVRTNEPLSAADICSLLGGGGHRLAAGCEMRASLQEVVNALVKAVKDEMENYRLCGENK